MFKINIKIKNKHFFLYIFPMISIILFLSACGQTNSIQNEVIHKPKDYDISMYFSDVTIGQFKELFEAYKQYSGKVIKIINTGKNEKISDYMESSSPPDVFSIVNFDELEEQKNSGNILDFINITDASAKDVTQNIPEKLKIGLNEINSCGIPLSVESCGLVTNSKIISKIFGESITKNILNDLKSCSFEDFSDFVYKIDEYTKNRSSNTLYLNDKKYKILADATGSGNLVCTFSISSQAPYMNILNHAIAAEFSTGSDFREVNNLESYSNLFKIFMKSIDLITSHTITGRGTSLIDDDINSESQAIRQFVQGQSLFLVAQDSVFEKIAKLDPECANNLILLPFKMPLSASDITSINLTPKKLNSSITISCPIYLAINAKSNDLKTSQDFIAWIKNSPHAQRILTENLNFLPYDINSVNSQENILKTSTINNLNTNNYIPNICTAAPISWQNIITTKLQEFLKKSSWNDETYDEFAGFCVTSWGN
ncbi:MAG: extracellular solute-binding protein [Candidatus Improbicoccus devescovinae]|nr:MAG: extracellular solute-binding protein [Candidatus Improbicoccus devescovinae]